MSNRGRVLADRWAHRDLNRVRGLFAVLWVDQALGILSAALRWCLSRGRVYALN
jgi:hypothetical protein